MKNKKHLDLDLICIIMGISPFLIGLMPLWSNYLLAIVCICGIIFKVKKNKKLIVPVGKNFILLCIYIFSFLIVNFYAVDKGMNIMNFFKNFTIMLFLILYMQYNYDDDKKQKMYDILSVSATFSVIISMILAIMGAKLVYNNERLQGVFAYANSYGLFLLIAIFNILTKEKLDKKEYIKLFILSLGIILTNSRSIIILTIISILMSIVVNKKCVKKILIVLLSFIMLFASVYILTNIEKRVSGEMLQSSEFLTRLLYYNDALDMIKENPFGYGYEGWYYKQVEIQTGVYDTKYVHNSVLQVLLDVGIIPTIAIAVLLILTIFKTKMSLKNRLILILILGHSLIDIDLEFMIFILLIVTMIKFEEKEYNVSKGLLRSFSTIFSLVYTILFLAGISYECGDYEFAYKIVPFYTEAMQEELYSTANPEKQYSLAEKIYKLNKNVSGVYEAFSNKLKAEEKYYEALEYEKKRLNLNKYSMINYINYTEYLSNALQYYRSLGDNEKVYKYADEVISVENKINEVLNNTNPLCYKTKHVPNLEMPEDMVYYINSIKEIVNKK